MILFVDKYKQYIIDDKKERYFYNINTFYASYELKIV